MMSDGSGLLERPRQPLLSPRRTRQHALFSGLVSLGDRVPRRHPGRIGGLEGLSAFVTGGGTGIGLACAPGDRGARRHRCDRRAPRTSSRTPLGGDPPRHAIQCDATDNDSVNKAVQTAVERNGPLRLAVNCAYQAMVGSVLAAPPDLFAMTVESTLTGTYRSCSRPRPELSEKLEAEAS